MLYLKILENHTSLRSLNVGEEGAEGDLKKLLLLMSLYLETCIYVSAKCLIPQLFTPYCKIDRIDAFYRHITISWGITFLILKIQPQYLAKMPERLVRCCFQLRC